MAAETVVCGEGLADGMALLEVFEHATTTSELSATTAENRPTGGAV
jgi:hypothetical protein